MERIVSVTYLPLNNNDNRRGIIAIFRMRKEPDRTCTEKEGIITVQDLAARLFETPFCPKEMRGVKGEIHKCWIYPRRTKSIQIALQHKYWTNDELEAFYAIVQEEARQYGWRVNDKRHLKPPE